uniref:TSCPD domain-containing protein n=1 Tax=Roseovarius salis TaxID=3376063 RepID=UPI0037C515CC
MLSVSGKTTSGEIGSSIVGWAKKKGISLRALSIEAGLGPNYVEQLIKYNKAPSVDNVAKIAQALNVSVAEILGDGAPEVLAATDAEPQQPHGDVVYMSEPLDRPAELEGATYKLKWPDSNHAIYVTVNDIILNGHRRPFEVFINSKNMEHYAWTVALTRMISAVFRRGGDVSFVVEELKAVFDPRGGAWMNGKYVPSILAAIGGVLERHMIAIGFLEGEGLGLKGDPTAQVVNLDAPKGPACPACGQYDMRMIEGCMTCASCGHSKCG